MKILICLALVVVALSHPALVELSGFKTADQLLSDVQSDPENVYAIIFFKRDDTNFELTKTNKEILQKSKDAADDLAF